MMATFKNSPASGANSASTGGGQATNGGSAHADPMGLMGRCLESNSETRPETVQYPTAKETNS